MKNEVAQQAPHLALRQNALAAAGTIRLGRAAACPRRTPSAAENSKRDEISTKRTICAIMVSRRDHLVTFRFEGSGFMYHMVRILTGTLLEAGTGRRTPESVREALRTKNREQAGFPAPARGLFLKEVWYEKTDIMECKRNPGVCPEGIP